MKDDVIEILSYVFKKCISEDILLPFTHEQAIEGLRSQGVSEENIAQAFMWLATLNQQPYLTNIDASSGSMRIFDQDELDKIGATGCGFVIFLEKIGILNAKTREVVINQLMLLPQPTCRLLEIKWVVLIVLISCADKVDLNLKLRCLAVLIDGEVPC